MPYIPHEEREPFGTPARRLGVAAVTVGQLNFNITSMILSFLGPHPHYRDFNEAIGALECIKQELYRRMVAPYEDMKIKENGDVYS